ncbi:MAG: GatB/YqeY domain-containing protein [Caldilineaceae bacterium]|nr:GatB/YqeY domain-containing protein [Caldilineaceae bacterium]
MPVVLRMKTDLLMAMKARQHSAVAALRSMLSAIDNAGAVEVDTSVVPLTGISADVPRRELSEAEVWALLRAEAEARRSAIARYEELGKMAEAARLRAELEVVALYLDDPALHS